MPELEKEKLNKLERLVAVLPKIYPPMWELLFRSFLQGLFTALGATIGLSIFIAIISFILGRLGLLGELGRLGEILKINK